MTYTLRIFGLSLFLGLIGLSFSTKASDNRFYIAGYLGLNLSQESDFSNSSAGLSGEYDLESAPSFGGALGFRLTPRIAIEAEANFTSADIDNLSTQNGSGSPGGELDVTTFMLNGVFDFGGEDWGVQPFVTAGVGVGLFDGTFGNNNGITQTSSGDDTALVYQAGAGLKWAIDDALALTGAYRYVGSTDIDLGNANIDYGAHEFRMGLSYELPFGGPSE